MTCKEARERLDAALAPLAEHFDHIQILATWEEPEGTGSSYRGAGNWYARQGMAHDFINQEVAQETATQLADALE